MKWVPGLLLSGLGKTSLKTIIMVGGGGEARLGMVNLDISVFSANIHPLRSYTFIKVENRAEHCSSEKEEEKAF